MNPVKRKARKTSFLILLGLAVMVAFFGYQTEHHFLMYYSFFCLLVVLCFGNIYLRWRHKIHYTKHVKNRLKDNPTEIVEIEITEDQISVIDRVSNSTIKISEITVVNEISSHYFLTLSTATHLIIPKTIPALNGEVDAMIRKVNIPHVINLDWKWS